MWFQKRLPTSNISGHRKKLQKSNNIKEIIIQYIQQLRNSSPNKPLYGKEWLFLQVATQF